MSGFLKILKHAAEYNAGSPACNWGDRSFLKDYLRLDIVQNMLATAGKNDGDPDPDYLGGNAPECMGFKVEEVSREMMAQILDELNQEALFEGITLEVHDVTYWTCETIPSSQQKAVTWKATVNEDEEDDEWVEDTSEAED